MPPSGAAESRERIVSDSRESSGREALPDDYVDRQSSNVRPGSAKTRVVRDTVSIRSISPVPPIAGNSGSQSQVPQIPKPVQALSNPLPTTSGTHGSDDDDDI